MRAVILAAGKGSRLNGAIGDKPKCLLRVGDRTLIERQIETLRTVGIDDIVVVTGCQMDRVKRTCGSSVTYVTNARYAQTNSLYSLWLARTLLLDGFIVLNCDVLFHPHLLSDLLTARHEDALLVAYRDDPLGDEEMKIKARRGRVMAIAKTLDAEDADGENVGIAKFGATGARLLATFLEQRVAEGRLRDWVPHAFDDFARVRPLHLVGTRGYPWTEIDFPEDYEHAVRNVLPAIESDEMAVTGVRANKDAPFTVPSLRRSDRAASVPLPPAAGE